MPEIIEYACPSTLTSLEGISPEVVGSVAYEPVAICSPVHDLVVQPREAEKLGLPHERFGENQLRPAGKIVAALLALGPEPLSVARESRPAGGRDVPALRSPQLCSLAL